jgi:hypothetical protein
LAQENVSIPGPGKAGEIDYASLAQALARLMQPGKGGRLRLPEPFRESLWVIGGLCDAGIMPEVLDSLGVDGVALQVAGAPRPADAAVRLWLVGRNRAIRIYNRHHGDQPGYHPIDEARISEEGRAEGARYLLSLRPNQAFLLWRGFCDDLGHCPKVGRANELKTRAMMDALREWFEDLGHWRGLDPKAKDLDPDDHNAHARHQKEIEDFVAQRQVLLRVVEYDDFRAAHKPEHEDKDHGCVDYEWIYLLAGEPQVTLTIQAGNVLPPHNDPSHRDYFRRARPYGYAIAETKGTAYFRNGPFVPFDCGFDGGVYQPRNFEPGDYELREVTKRGATLDDVRADVREFKELATRPALTPEDAAKLEEIRNSTSKTLAHAEAMRPHVEGVPPLVRKAEDALADPLGAADDARRQMPLDRKEHEVRDAVIECGTQRAAALKLGISEPTVCRRMQKIRRKMKAAGFSDALVLRPSQDHRRHTLRPDRPGMNPQEEIEAPTHDWQADDAERKGLIRFYLRPGHSAAERAKLRKEYPDIQAEAEEYQRRTRGDCIAPK